MNELNEKFNGLTCIMSEDSEDLYELTCIMSEDGEDFFLDTESIATVLGRSTRTIEKYIEDVLDDMNEQQKMSFIREVPGLANRKPKKVYSSEVFIEIAYKVKTPQARQFRNWAIRILRRVIIYQVKKKLLKI